jgi:hypothetical protein
LELGLEFHGCTLAGDDNPPLLHRLAERTEQMDREFTEFIEKERPPMGECYLSWPRHAGSSPDQGSERCRVVRRAKRRERRIDPRKPGRGPSQRYLGNGVVVQPRHDCRQASGQHGLPSTGRTSHEEMVPARRSNLEGTASE